jgi:hypothetical protein
MFRHGVGRVPYANSIHCVMALWDICQPCTDVHSQLACMCLCIKTATYASVTVTTALLFYLLLNLTLI